MSGFEGRYEVSSRGRVRSLFGPRGLSRQTPVIKAQHLSTHVAWEQGYWMVNLCAGNITTRTRVHLVVLEAFVGPRPEDYHASHKDGYSLNNCIENLCWESPLENQRRKHDHGTQPHGEGHYNAILTDDAVREARRRNADGVGCRQLARDIGVPEGTLNHALKWRTWRHVT